jgi:ribosomal protein S1
MAARLVVREDGRRSWSWREKEDGYMSTWESEASRGQAAKPEDATAQEQSGRTDSARAPKAKQDGPVRRRRGGLAVTGPRQLEPGEIVTGVVVAIGEEGLLVDVGAKSEGLIPVYEFVDRSEMPAEGDEIEVAVVRMAEDDSTAILSKKSADYERVWRRILDAAETGEVLDAMVTERVKGGLRVDLGVPGFVPASHVATRDVRNLDRFVGRSLRLKVLEAGRESKKVVLSHRLVVEEEKRLRREETLARLRDGLVCEGKVRSLTDYGAFIDLGGVDGLLHVSEMAWSRVDHPSDVCRVGDTLRVVVLDVDRERNRISLGRRQILPDPWKQAAAQIKTDSLVRAKITRTVRTGAFAELVDSEIEGFIPVSELSDKRLQQASDAVKEGDEVTLKVLKIRPEARRMTLSLRGAEQEKERQEYQQYMASQEKAKITLGDQFAEVLGVVAEQVQETEEGAREQAEEAEAEASPPPPGGPAPAQQSDTEAAEAAQLAEDEDAADQPVEGQVEQADHAAVPREASEANEVEEQADATGGEAEGDGEAAEAQE